MPWLTPDGHQEEVEAARDIALRRLDRSLVPRAALNDLLKRKEVASPIAEEVLDRLESAGLVDDAAYAAALARTRFAEKGAARRAIAEEATALTLARKKLAATRGLEPAVRRRRTLALLGRKGYSQEVAMRAVERALMDRQD